MIPQKLVESLNEIKSVCINILCTRRCNYKCSHCMYSSSPSMPGDYMRAEDLFEIQLFAEELGRNLPNANISINVVGGEPTLDMEKFAFIMRTLEHWRHPNYPETFGLEMTTNGWWLETWESVTDFGKAVQEGLKDGMRIRISNSIYHDEFRNPAITKLFREGDGRNRLAEYFEDTLSIPSEHDPEEVCPSEDESEEDCETRTFEADEQKERVRMRNAWVVHWLLEAAEKGDLYIDTKIDAGKVSPVGRAKKNQFGYQDGPCHATEDVKFTFRPTKEGERPGRLYDPCCNGGKVPLGFADEGMKLLWKRMEYMEALHKKFPDPPEGNQVFNHNPLGGARCLNCPSFGAAWTRNNMPLLETRLHEASTLLQEKREAEEKAKQEEGSRELNYA